WSGIGHFRLERGEGQGALVALKRAEGMTADAAMRGRLQIGEARALLELNQQAAAVGLLVRFANQTSSEVAAPALALLGAVKFQDKNVDQALVLLKRAVGQGSAEDWPGRAEAEADLGLAFLSVGNEVHGLAWLHSAQCRFEAVGDASLLIQCLTNEM